MRGSPIGWREISLGCRMYMPLPSPDASRRGRRPADEWRLGGIVSIPKTSTVLPVHAAPPSRGSVFTGKLLFIREIVLVWRGCFGIRGARLFPLTHLGDFPMGGSR